MESKIAESSYWALMGHSWTGFCEVSDLKKGTKARKLAADAYMNCSRQAAVAAGVCTVERAGDLGILIVAGRADEFLTGWAAKYRELMADQAAAA